MAIDLTVEIQVVCSECDEPLRVEQSWDNTMRRHVLRVEQCIDCWAADQPCEAVTSC